MTKPDIEAAEQFLAANARVLERRRFERLLRGGGPEPVRDAVAAYRNPDGGFGQALEPDGRCPGSQSLAVDFALQALLHADAWDTGLAAGACDWLAARAPAGGGAVFVDASIEGWPHAPWWVPEEGEPASLTCTGLLGGTLYAAGVSHPWLTEATGLLWDGIGNLTEAGPYDMRALLWFLEQVPDTGRARAALDRLGPMIFDLGLVTLEPGAPGEIHAPLDFAPRPGSPARGLFDPVLIEAHLDHLAASQQADGGWTFNWLAWSPAAEREWRGIRTVEALSVLRANNRL
ncbi:MAG: hypothetical protein J2P33_15435 [Actinobacteria bacterium]|nr:hypothetical protein [Actinomycetota bacterium]